MVTPGSIGRGLAAIGATVPWGRCDDVDMRTRWQARVARRAGTMAAMKRNPAAAGVVLVVVGLLVVFGVFLALLRAMSKDASPGLLSAQGMAHRLLTGRESISTDVQTDGEYVFRVVFQGSDGNVGSTEYATHIGVAVCMRGDQAVDAVRFSYLHFKPSCSGGRVRVTPAETSIAADRKAFGGDFVDGADRQDEPTPRRIGSP
jgi:hypothetical protein